MIFLIIAIVGNLSLVCLSMLRENGILILLNHISSACADTADRSEIQIAISKPDDGLDVRDSDDKIEEDLRVRWLV